MRFINDAQKIFGKIIQQAKRPGTGVTAVEKAAVIFHAVAVAQFLQHFQVEAGALVYVDGPYGAFSCDRHADASGFLFIAGGIGIVPIMSMLRALADRADKRPIWLFYANRLWQHTVFPEELAELSQRLPLRVVHILGEPPADWMGERGLLSLALLRRHLPRVPAGVHGFVCGPRPMIKIAERALQELEVPLARVHSEIFDLA